MNVLLRGSGVGIAACAHLLRQSGTPFAIDPGRRRPVPVIMLSDPALTMLRDVFGNPALFADKPRITRRIVRWGSRDAVVMPHGAIVVSEGDLAAALGPATGAPATVGPATDDPDFTVHAAAPFPATEMLRFGDRRAAAARVVLCADAPAATCWVESVPDGWIFLIPDGGGQAWLLAVGEEPAALAAQSRLVAPLIAAMVPDGGGFDTSPRMLATLAADGWIACGMAAIAFDPICGDGTGQAVREAILACAVISAIARGEDREALLGHYRAMLLAAMRRHLQLSLPFYGDGGNGPWWQAQIAAARHGYAACTERLGSLPPPGFVLRGFDLVRRELAA